MSLSIKHKHHQARCRVCSHTMNHLPRLTSLVPQVLHCLPCLAQLGTSAVPHHQVTDNWTLQRAQMQRSNQNPTPRHQAHQYCCNGSWRYHRLNVQCTSDQMVTMKIKTDQCHWRHWFGSLDLIAVRCSHCGRRC